MRSEIRSDAARPGARGARQGLQAMAVAALLLLPFFANASAAADGRPLQVAYYYKVRWGFQAEFERLFLKNHLPLLLAQKEQGRIKAVNLYRPTFHGDGHADWTFLVVLTFPSWATFGTPSGEEELAKKIFPDQETYEKEEQRRFEILEAHWDVPLAAVPIPAPAKP
jgi:hypothetical protein